MCVYVYMFAHVYKCIYIYMYICVYIFIYIHITKYNIARVPATQTFKDLVCVDVVLVSLRHVDISM